MEDIQANKSLVIILVSKSYFIKAFEMTGRKIFPTMFCPNRNYSDKPVILKVIQIRTNIYPRWADDVHIDTKSSYRVTQEKKERTTTFKDQGCTFGNKHFQ